MNRSANVSSQTTHSASTSVTWWRRKSPSYAVLTGAWTMSAIAVPNQVRQNRDEFFAMMVTRSPAATPAARRPPPIRSAQSSVSA
jgi:hypothetical protein